jgi:LDH2 family malate/lactate/ureidoglycolate dehydrogenase
MGHTSAPSAVSFSVAELEDVATRTLRGLGVPDDLADLTAHSLARSNLMGHDSHGVRRLVQYAAGITGGQIRPEVRASVRRRFGATAVVDGNWGLGQPAAVLATGTAVELAGTTGIGAVALATCNHVGRLGEYVERMAEAGCIGLALCNSGAIVAPAGGRRRTFGTNPLAVAAPIAGGPPLVHDFATAGVAEGKVHEALDRGDEVAPGLVIDRDGRPSTRPADLYDGGALLPFGGHKGSGLSLMIELIGGLLTGMGAASMPDYAGGNGTMLLALSIEAFTSLDGFASDAAAFGAVVVQDDDDGTPTGVLLPGQLERRTAAARAVEGVQVPLLTRRHITEVAESVGVDLGRFAVPE